MCPWHQGTFDARTGDLLEPPPTDDVRNEPPCRDDFEAACEISACLATWDLTKAVPTWRWLTAFYRQWNDHMADQGPKYLEYMAQLRMSCLWLLMH